MNRPAHDRYPGRLFLNIEVTEQLNRTGGEMKLADTDGITFLDYNQNDNPDGGYHDVCNSLLKQIDHVEMKYKDQLAGLGIRRQNLKDDIKRDIVSSILCVAFLFILIGITAFLEFVMWSGLFAILYVVIKILFPGIVVVVLLFVLPAFLRQLNVNIRNYYIMNGTIDAKLVIDREVITYKQEEQYLKDKLAEIVQAREAHKKVEAEYVGKFDEEWDETLQNDVYRLRSASIYREYYAQGLKKDGAVKQGVISAAVMLIAVFLVVFWVAITALAR